jgi:cholesterol transport system auxiliary component
MKFYYTILTGFLLLSGCSLKEAPVMKVYSLAVPSVIPVSSSPYRSKILKVAYPIALNEKLNNDMHYSYSLTDRGDYLNSCWSNNVGRLLQGSFIQILSQAQIFKVVVPFASNVEENLRLESTLFDLSHHIRGERSYAVLSIQFTLMNAENGKLLKARKFRYTETTQSTDAKGYVNAMNRIIARLSRDLVAWLR